MLKRIAIGGAAVGAVAAVTAGFALANGSLSAAHDSRHGGLELVRQSAGEDVHCSTSYQRWRSTGSSKWKQRYLDCKGW